MKKSKATLTLRWYLALLAVSFAAVTMAQEPVLTLSPEDYLAIVRQYHPVAKQAVWQVNAAEAQLLSSRGMFDPSVYFTNEQKNFSGKEYYKYSNVQLKIPTWFGVELMGGIENNAGVYADPELTQGQSSYAGLSIPLGKNLLMDKRRAALAQAKLMVNQSKAEQQLALNDLLYEAIGAYWNWVRDYQVYKIVSNAVEINEKRYNLLKVTVEQGDRAGADSTEALTQLLSFRAVLNDAWMRFQNSGYELSNYLWTKEEQPYLLPSTISPSVKMDVINPYSIPYQPLNDLLVVADSVHPKLQSYQYKLQSLDFERKLKFQSLLPTLNLKYNALAEGYQWWNGINSTSMQNNYKFGVDAGIPLLLRQGRGDYRSAKIKIQSVEIERDYTRQSISNKIRQYHTEMVNLLQQVSLSEQALKAYQKVFEVELMKFEIGESTLFMINSRENKVLEAQQKVTDVKAKFFKSLYGVQWAAGILR